MKTITLTDGTQYEFDWCHGDKGILNINIVSGATNIVELAIKFGNRELTSCISVFYGEESQFNQEYKGYTELYAISIDGWQTGTTLITLMTPERKEQAI